MTIILILYFLIGLCLGSFINVIAYRLPLRLQETWQKNCLNFLNMDEQTHNDGKLLKPFNLFGLRSHCPYCHEKIKIRHNIPLISFIYLKGHCRYCNKRISLIYPLTELITALLLVFILLEFHLTLNALFAAIFICALITLSVIDIRTQLLPDTITLPLLWLGLIINSFSTFTTLTMALWGAVIGYMALWLIYTLYKVLKKTDALGFGDLKCLSAIGAWLGVNALLPVLLIASITALMSIVIIKLTKARTDHNQKPIDRIAFGPFLALASIIVLFWHNTPVLMDLSITSIL